MLDWSTCVKADAARAVVIRVHLERLRDAPQAHMALSYTAQVDVLGRESKGQCHERAHAPGRSTRARGSRRAWPAQIRNCVPCGGGRVGSSAVRDVGPRNGRVVTVVDRGSRSCRVYLDIVNRTRESASENPNQWSMVVDAYKVRYIICKLPGRRATLSTISITAPPRWNRGTRPRSLRLLPRSRRCR